jgi:hypothetical protein
VYFRDDDATAKQWLKRAPKDGSAEAEELIALEPLLDTETGSITVEGESLYWTSDNGAFGAPKGGGAVMFRTLGHTPSLILAVEAGAVYFFSDGLQVRRVDGETLILSLSIIIPSGMAVDTGYVYWTWTGGGLARTEKSPGDTDILWSSELLVNPLMALDDAYIYLGIRGATYESEGTVLRIAKQGGEAAP